MIALLLAGGLGTRLRPLTYETPKCLVLINNKPLLDYWLELLRNDLISKIIINTHYLPSQVIEFIEKKNIVINNKIILVHEEELLGTGGTILHNKKYLFDKIKPFIVAHADNLSLFNLSEFINYHNNNNKILITMMTFITDDPCNCGIVTIDNNNIVTNFYEKINNPPGFIANGAVYIMDISVIEFMEKLYKKNIDLSIEVIPFFLGKIQSYLNSTYHRDIGTQKSLLLANLEYNAFL